MSQEREVEKKEKKEKKVDFAVIDFFLLFFY